MALQKMRKKIRARYISFTMKNPKMLNKDGFNVEAELTCNNRVLSLKVLNKFERSETN